MKLKNLMTGEVVIVRSTTDHSTSSYGQPVWVDADGKSYGIVSDVPPIGYDFLED